ncbi:MAG: hypothetical protein WD554_00250 [Flavobacteriaceae bacterium]
MAKVKSLLQITGSLDDLTFYTLNGQAVVRRKGGGFTSKGVKKGANYVRTRENASEFGHCSAFSKQLRVAVQPLLGPKAFDSMHQHLVKVLFAIKNLDTISARGKRHVGQGIQHPEAASLLHGFSFNPHCALDHVLKAPYSLTDSVFNISQFTPVEAFHFPKGATAVGLEFGACVFDFLKGEGRLGALSTAVLDQDGSEQDLELPATVPAGTGTLLYVLKIAFYQQAGGERYLFKNKEYGTVALLIA